MGLKAKSDLSQRKRNLTFATDKSLCYWYCGTWSCRNGQKRSTRRPEGGEEPAVLSILHSQIVLIRQFRRAVTVWFFICSFVIRVSAEIASGELQLASRGGRPSGGGEGGRCSQLTAAESEERTNERAETAGHVRCPFLGTKRKQLDRRELSSILYNPLNSKSQRVPLSTWGRADAGSLAQRR